MITYWIHHIFYFFQWHVHHTSGVWTVKKRLGLSSHSPNNKSYTTPFSFTATLAGSRRTWKVCCSRTPKPWTYIHRPQIFPQRTLHYRRQRNWLWKRTQSYHLIRSIQTPQTFQQNPNSFGKRAGEKVFGTAGIGHCTEDHFGQQFCKESENQWVKAEVKDVECGSGSDFGWYCVSDRDCREEDKVQGWWKEDSKGVFGFEGSGKCWREDGCVYECVSQIDQQAVYLSFCIVDIVVKVKKASILRPNCFVLSLIYYRSSMVVICRE